MARRFGVLVVVLCSLPLLPSIALAWTWPVTGPVLRPFSFDRARVSLGFTPQAGGEMDVSDPVDRRRVSVSDIPELDLEPLFLALRGRVAEDRLDVWTAPPWHEAEPAVPGWQMPVDELFT